MAALRIALARCTVGALLLFCVSVARGGEPERELESQSDAGETQPPEPVAAEQQIAAESPDALIAQGIEFRKRREDQRALAAFERAWRLGGSARALAQLALAEQAIGLWREAHEHLEQALSRVDDPWIASHHDTLELALGEIASRLGTLELSCNVAGAEVFVDGRSVGRTPLEQGLRLTAGRSVVQVVAEGYYEMVQPVQVDAGAISRMSFSLTPVSSPPVVSTVPAPAVHETPAERARHATPQLTLAAGAIVDASSSTRQLLTYTSAGLAALGAAVGVTGYAIREINIRDYNDDARCARQPGTRRSIECDDEFAAWKRGEALVIAGSVAAVLFGAAALYLGLSEPARDMGPQLSCSVAGTAVTCGRAF